MLMENESYSTVFLAEVLSRLLPEKVKEENVFSSEEQEVFYYPRQAALLVVSKVAGGEITGSAFGNALYWALGFLLKMREYGGRLLPCFETSCMIAGLNGALVNFFSEIDQAEAAANYELPYWE